VILSDESILMPTRAHTNYTEPAIDRERFAKEPKKQVFKSLVVGTSFPQAFRAPEAVALSPAIIYSCSSSTSAAEVDYSESIILSYQLFSFRFRMFDTRRRANEGMGKDVRYEVG
jgi:hypothetical protein